MLKTRPRRLRSTPFLRTLIRETHLGPQNLIVPYFVVHGEKVRRPIPSMPGQYQLSVDELVKEAAQLESLGLKAVLLFGLPAKKDARGSQAWSPNGIVQQAVRELKKHFPQLVVMTDLCFCEYTSHGHCGVVKKNKKRERVIDNDTTLKLLGITAVAQAHAGADFVAPSGMMDGAVRAIRLALDQNGHTQTGILAYSAKYASVFYGPFRDAAASAPQFGDRRSYQMDPSNIREAIREIQMDVLEGADMVMVKPALSYLDVIHAVRPELKIPLVAYNVSGEYAMVKAAEKLGWLQGSEKSQAAMEILLSIRRAGADLIISYHALEVARQLRSQKS
ncbi:MAG: Delta-aminolevulinic acid dehydratase [Elusimicrobia bacterium]|nr:Delta-aminolevulinic acid dehydratase [Elusimicrobiota bacterium]